MRSLNLYDNTELYYIDTGSAHSDNKRFKEECEELQTVPQGYTNHVSASQRYKMLGNGWTVDVIAHILSYLK